MNEREQRVHEALRGASAPGESEAEERAWRLIRTAYAERTELRPSSRLRRRGLQLALVIGLLAALISPAGAEVRHWVSDAVSPGREPSRPTLTSLPAPGPLLVQSPAGPWVVHPDGSKRLLGTYAGATWSPRGFFVAVTTRHELAAVDPEGQVRWTLDRRGPVRLPSWNEPDGFRIAYLSGRSLRVVAGDGTGDRLLEPRVASVAPAWMPGPRYVLAFAKLNGSVEAVRADSGKEVFTTRPGPLPRSLQWSTDGRRLLVVRRAAIEIRNPGGHLLWRWAALPGTDVVAARLDPNRARVVLVLNSGVHAVRSRLLLAGPGRRTRAIFSGPGRFTGAEWSPNGRWLLLAWKSADQWLFLNPSRPRRVVAVSNISSQFAPGERRPGQVAFPQVRGWCCSR